MKESPRGASKLSAGVSICPGLVRAFEFPQAGRANSASAPSYISYSNDPTTQNAILILTDMVGCESINTRLLADQFAVHGYLCVVPDLFHGDAFPLNEIKTRDIGAWLQNHPADRVDPIIDAVINALRKERGIEHIGGVGYCFGGKYVARFLKPHKLEVGYVAHPSFMSAEELRGITGPLSIAAAGQSELFPSPEYNKSVDSVTEVDEVFPATKRHESEEILRNLKPHIPYQISLYSEVRHGFAVRGDLSVKSYRFAKEAAFHQAVVWFDEHLKPK